MFVKIRLCWRAAHCVFRQSWQWMSRDWWPCWFFTWSSWSLGSGHLENPRKRRRHVLEARARSPSSVAATSMSLLGFSPWQVEAFFPCPSSNNSTRPVFPSLCVFCAPLLVFCSSSPALLSVLSLLSATWVGGGYIMGTAEAVYVPTRGVIWALGPPAHLFGFLLGE